ncbi:MAG: BON domain-containing protein [Pirellulaceae bacterium]
MMITRLTTVLLLIVALASTSNADSNAARGKNVSDQAIELEIQRDLRSTFWLVAPNIDARVVSGKVTLRGNVPNFRERTRISRRISGIEGVRQVHNRLKVERPPIEASRFTSHRGQNVNALSYLRATSKMPPTVIRGTIETQSEDHLIVRDFRQGLVETKVEKSAVITLDGKHVDAEVLSEGLLVFVDAEEQQGDLIATSVEAHSPK